jgi:hypothetical protein
MTPFRLARRVHRLAPRSRRLGAASIALIMGLALAGCSGSSATDGVAPDPGSAPMAPPGPDGGLAEAPGYDNGSPDAPLAPLSERSIRYTGTITVEVESVVQAADEASALVIGLGGFVAGDNRSIEEDRAQATLILRVPAQRFTAVLDDLADLGTERSRQVQAEDVTEQLVDLDARIATQQASVDRVRELLARAETIGEIVSLESELTRRQADLDSLVARRAAMSGLVDLATITVVLRGPNAPAEDTEPEIGFLAGLRAGWQGFLASVTVVLTIIGWLLPFAFAIGVPVVAILAVVRRRRRRRVVTPPPAG